MGHYSLIVFVFLSGISCIWFYYREPEWLVYIFKPLTMVLICLIAILGGNQFTIYKIMIVAGLSFSLAGDVFLMLPSDRFLAGIAAFLLTHLFYSVAFGSLISSLIWWPLFPLVICAIVFIRSFSPHFGNLKIPILIYILTITLILWFAGERWIQEPHNSSLLAFGGAILFVISDILLATDRFKGEFRKSRAIVLGIYFTSQMLIASSTRF
ncbi:MAG: lysoplasmalogenase [Anaerolineales bacterium]